MHSYAVLWDIDSRESLPVGIAIERGDHVYVDIPEEYDLPSRYDGDYRVLQPDISEIIYKPGNDGYFEQVLVELSRNFAIVERGEVDTCDEPQVMRLLLKKVHLPRNRSRVGAYPVAAPAASSAHRLVVARGASVYVAPDRYRVAARVGGRASAA